MKAARQSKALLLLNIQPGQSDFMTEIKRFEKYLKEPDVGIALDPDRRPTLRLAAEHVTIGGHVHEVVDLSTPGAVAEAAGTVVSDVADGLLAQLGAVGDAARALLGLAPPAGFPYPASGVG